MDHYKTMDNLLNAFCEFVETLPENGKAIVCGDNESIRYVMNRVKRNFITYGLDDSNDYVAKNIHYVDSTLVYDVYHKGVNIDRVRLRVPGDHNVLNSLAAFIVAHDCCGVEARVITKGLGKFIGAKRRFETKGHVAGVWVGTTIPNAIKEATGQDVNYVPSVDDLPEVLAKVVRPNDLVITMGAGSINQYGPKLLAILEEGLQ